MPAFSQRDANRVHLSPGKGRKTVAHGVSRGSKRCRRKSPGRGERKKPALTPANTNRLHPPTPNPRPPPYACARRAQATHPRTNTLVLFVPTFVLATPAPTRGARRVAGGDRREPPDPRPRSVSPKRGVANRPTAIAATAFFVRVRPCLSHVSPARVRFPPAAPALIRSFCHPRHPKRDVVRVFLRFGPGLARPCLTSIPAICRLIFTLRPRPPPPVAAPSSPGAPPETRCCRSSMRLLALYPRGRENSSHSCTPRTLRHPLLGTTTLPY